MPITFTHNAPERRFDLNQVWWNLTLPFRNWWACAFGRRTAFKEGMQLAFDNAAMKAYDMGRPDIREEINKLAESAREA